MAVDGIANILHRETIAMIAGTRTFERGEHARLDRDLLDALAVTGRALDHM